MKPLKELHKRKDEIARQCKEKQQQISAQSDYIIENFGDFAIRSIIGNRFKRGTETKTSIIKFLIAESIDTAVNIQKDPHNVKDKLIHFFKETSSGILNLLLK